MEQLPNADKRRDFADGVGSISYENGDHFRGRFSNNGETLELGSFEYARGVSPKRARYVGQFSKDFPSGLGTLEFPNGDLFAGAFECGKPSGSGVYTFANGDTLTGLFEDGRIVRGARVLAATKSKYNGEFDAEVRPHGLGRLDFANGDAYEGAWREGAFHGEGTYAFSDGSQVTCKSWVNDNVTGATEISTRAGDRFVGQFSSARNEPFGRGQMWFSTGATITCADMESGGGLRRIAAKHVPPSWALFSPRAGAARVWIMSHKDCVGLAFGEGDALAGKDVLAAHQQLQFSLASRPAVTWVEAAATPPRPIALRGLDVAEDALRAVFKSEADCVLGLIGPLVSREQCPVRFAADLCKAPAALWVGKGVPREFGAQLADVVVGAHEPACLVVGVQSGAWSASDEAYAVGEVLKCRPKRVVVLHVGGGSTAQFSASVAAVAETLVNS